MGIACARSVATISIVLYLGYRKNRNAAPITPAPTEEKVTSVPIKIPAKMVKCFVNFL